MNLTDWLRPGDIAILDVAIYYGLPAFGHPNCYKHIEPSEHPLCHMTRKNLREVLPGRRCAHCGKLLVPAESEEVS